MFVPVLNFDNKPLMPTSPSRARRWILSKKATPFWKKGVFCVRLNQNPSNNQTQEIAVGIDPGSKKEGFTVKSEAHTFLNIQADAVTWVKRRMKIRMEARRRRRYRKTPYRKCRLNRSAYKKIGRLSPSTKARWQWKLRVVSWLSKMFPITVFVVEDIKAKTKKDQRRWNESFSPLQQGKNWFYEELIKYSKDKVVIKKSGWETKELRDSLGLHKTSSKLSKSFDAHCVDSWVLANYWVGGHIKPDSKKILYIKPFQFHRRQLHFQTPNKGGKRHRYGTTNSFSFKRGAIIKHKKKGLGYLGGVADYKGSVIINTPDGKSYEVKITDLSFLSFFNSWMVLK